MRIAVILRGHYRTFDHLADAWRNSFSETDVQTDFYVHTWDRVNSVTQTWYKSAQQSTNVAFLSTIQRDTLLKFDRFATIESQRELTPDESIPFSCGIPYAALEFAWHGITSCIARVLASGETYDAIVVGRLDADIRACASRIAIDLNALSPGCIFLGARVAPHKEGRYQNLSASDVLFAVHGNDVQKLAVIPPQYAQWRAKRSMFQSPECPWTAYAYEQFDVTVKWKLHNDFDLLR